MPKDDYAKMSERPMETDPDKSILEINLVKTEPSEVETFGDCGMIDNNRSISEIYNSGNSCSEQKKFESCEIDIKYEDIKTEMEEEQKVSISSLMDFEGTKLVYCCLQSIDMVGEDMTHDLKPLDTVKDPKLEPRLEAEDEIIIKKEDNLIHETFTDGPLSETCGNHTGNTPFYCKIYSKSFELKSDLKNLEGHHIKINETNQSREIPFQSRTRSKTASKNAYSKSQPFRCKICSKSFTRKSNFKTHERTHAGNKLFKWKICSKSFTRASYAKYQKKSHTEKKPFLCNICMKSFVLKSSLTIHERIHTGNKLSQCKICSKSFTRCSHLKVHERIHTGEKPFQCKICSKYFNQASVLKVHERIHTGERPFQCEICSKSFNQGGVLKVHQRIHSKQKPFQCKTCSKSFAQNNHLKIHERSHARTKPFQCEICSKSFSRKDYFKVHGKTHTKNNVLSL